MLGPVACQTGAGDRPLHPAPLIRAVAMAGGDAGFTALFVGGDIPARALLAALERHGVKKLQPEGGHEPIVAGSKLYRKSLRTTAVVAIEVEEMTAKFKFGQNLPATKREEVAGKLEARGCPVDHATVEAMRRYNR